jgi:hypothetical protein
MSKSISESEVESGGRPLAEGLDIDFRIARDCDLVLDGEPIF